MDMWIRKRVGWWVTAAALCIGGAGCGQPDHAQPEAAPSAQADASVYSAAAIGQMRERGREGLAELLAVYDETEAEGEEWDRVLDAVGGARDTATSRLFWETDLDRALAEARRRDVPVLSLRMLGRLTDERSCANSRFFRTVLYADPGLARWLDSNFVLHWSSERPVPQVTIDFGDGRTIRTTTTGNSAHYVFSGDGTVVDVVPGLYTPQGFRRALDGSRGIEEIVRESPTLGQPLLRSYHATALAQSERALSQRLLEVGQGVVDASALRAWMLRVPDPGPVAAAPSAELAVPIAFGKSRVELPVIKALRIPDLPEFPVAPDLPIGALAAAEGPNIGLSEPTLARMRRDRPRRPQESDAAYADRIAAMVQGFSELLVADEITNEYRNHAIIHRWFSSGEVQGDFESLNERVYRELFLTPRADPWLGLLDESTYDALNAAGVTTLPG